MGAIFGLVLGEKASFLYPIGQIWLNLLLVLLVPLIFFSISSSIAGIAGIYMFIVTGIFGVDTSIQLETTGAEVETAVDSIGDQIVNTFTVSDFPLVISRAHILALIVFTVFFGITVSLLGEKGRPVAE